jgi:hypothetical protein
MTHPYLTGTHHLYELVVPIHRSPLLSGKRPATQGWPASLFENFDRIQQSAEVP